MKKPTSEVEQTQAPDLDWADYLLRAVGVDIRKQSSRDFRHRILLTEIVEGAGTA